MAMMVVDSAVDPSPSNSGCLAALFDLRSTRCLNLNKRIEVECFGLAVSTQVQKLCPEFSPGHLSDAKGNRHGP
jgi:hypothetical protein